MCFNQRGDISTVKGGSLKVVDKFTYLRCSISSTKNDIHMQLAKSWTAINRLSVKISIKLFKMAVNQNAPGVDVEWLFLSSNLHFKTSKLTTNDHAYLIFIQETNPNSFWAPSCQSKIPLPQKVCPCYIKLHPVTKLKLWEVFCLPSLPLLPDPLWPGNR